MSYLNNSSSVEWKLNVTGFTYSCVSFWWKQTVWQNGNNITVWDANLQGDESTIFLNFPTTGTAYWNLASGASTPILTGSDVGWQWVGIIYSGSGARILTRREGSASYTDTTINGTGTISPAGDCQFLGGNGNPGLGMYMTQIFFYNSVTAAQLQQQSQQNTPVDSSTSNLIAWFGAANGSTVGHDQSGNGNNAVVTGSITTNASEPNISLAFPSPWSGRLGIGARLGSNSRLGGG